MELQRYLAIFRRRRLLIVVTVLAAMFGAYFLTSSESQYTAQAIIYVGKQQITVQDLSADRAAGTDRIVATYAQMIRTEPVARLAIERTGLPFTDEDVVAKTVSFAVPPTFLLKVQVSDSEPTVARDLANGLVDSFVERIQDFEPTQGSTTTSTTSAGAGAVPASSALPAYVFKRADLPTAPLAVDTLRNLVLSAIFGLLAAFGIALALDYLDVTIKTVVDVEERLGIATLAVIPEHSEALTTRALLDPRKRVLTDG